MRDREETLRLLRDGFLWDGETVWFDYDDYGSIAEGYLLNVDSPSWNQRMAANFLDFYEKELVDEPNDAFTSAVINTTAEWPLVIYDCEEILFANYLHDRGMSPAEWPSDAMDEFKREYEESLSDYDVLLDWLSNDERRELPVRELMPSDLFKALEEAGVLPGHDELAERWPHVALELDRLGITRDGTAPACVMSHDEMSQAIHEAMDNVYGPGFYDLLSESRDMTASSEKLDADSARGEDVRDAPETSERG